VKQNNYSGKLRLFKNILLPIIFFFAGCIGTGIIYFFIILLWGLIAAPWIRIVNSNITSMILLLLSGFFTWTVLKKIVEHFQGRDQESHDQHQ